MTRNIVILSLVLVLAAAAQSLATVSTGGINFAVDAAVFSVGAEDTLLLEVYQEVDIAEFSRDSDGMSLFTTEVALCSVHGDTVAFDIWNTSLSWKESGRAVNCTVLPVIPGDWVLRVRILDVNNGIQGETVTELSVKAPGHFSDLELARTIMPAVENSVSPLLKGNIIVFPAASTRFTVPGESIVYTYQEIYSLGGRDLHRHSKLLDPAGLPIYARPAAAISIPDGMETVALLDSFDLAAVRETGLYTLSIAYLQNGDTLGVVTKPMVVEVVLPVTVSNNTVETVTTSCLVEFPLLLSGEEGDLFRRLDEDGQVLFYNSYWSARPGEHDEFQRSCRIVASRYTSFFKDGWETDMGRVYLLYGEPDEVEADPFSTDQAPHEIWSYYTNDQKKFVFADIAGNGDYVQLFSSVHGEVSYPNWQSMLKNVNSGIGTGQDQEF